MSIYFAIRGIRRQVNGSVSANEEFCIIKNEEVCIKNEELCIKNEEFCIQKDDLCRRVAALTSKHEKGFCLWPSKFSNFTIAHSPTVGHRDLVKEFTDECRQQGIKPGLYFTTTDTYNKDSPKKDEIQLQQMTELTTEVRSLLSHHHHVIIITSSSSSRHHHHHHHHHLMRSTGAARTNFRPHNRLIT